MPMWLAALTTLTLTGVHPTQEQDVLVAVSANFTQAIHDVVALFEARTGRRVIVSSGSSGTLYAQIRRGAPYHVFLSADEDRPRRLEAEGYAVPGIRLTYATGRLALWSNSRSAEYAPRETLERGDFRHLAIAMPSTAPYGSAARETLIALGLWERYARRIVRGQSIAQTHQFVASRNAELGFVAHGQVIEEPEDSFWLVPEELHGPIVQQAVLLAKGHSHPGARAFLEFLLSSEAQQIIRRHGYGVPRGT